MKYAAIGYSMPNDIIFVDGTELKGIIGGGSFFAYTGLKLCTDDCLFIAAVGADFDEYYSEWWDGNNCSRDGLMFRTDNSIYFYVKYLPDGTYEEGTIFTEEYDKVCWAENFIVASEIEKYVADGMKGLYLYGGNMDHLYCRTMQGYKDKYGLKIGWEFPQAYRILGNGQDDLGHIFDIVDYFSLNRKEAYKYFGVNTDADAVEELKKLGKPCYFRVGQDGAYFIDKGEVTFVPMISVRDNEVDPTGCGNISTAAAMWAFFEGYDPLRICIWAAICAGYNALQYGPYPKMDAETRAEAQKLMEELVIKFRK